MSIKKGIKFLLNFYKELDYPSQFVYAAAAFLISGGVVSVFAHLHENPFINYILSVVLVAAIIIGGITLIALICAALDEIKYIFEDTVDSYKAVRKRMEIAEKIEKAGYLIFSPVNGEIVKVYVHSNNATVKKDDVLFIVKSHNQKSETKVLAPKDGIVQEILVSEGDTISKDDCLILFY